ncbi:universal stress protein [Nocardioides gilvus]|uniref:universal stress protein n=1 Tax=Nocardioides gilvus TaxID=1735589 RepID=UPI000D74D315|nr:universal stress protein [Nocardioides gilvus]
MPGDRSPHILLAVGEHPIDAAAAWAVREATRRGCGVHLVHVLRPMHHGPPPALLESVDLHRFGRIILGAAAAKVREVSGESIEVTAELITGLVVPALVQATESACMVVLQHRDLSRLRRVITRSVTGGVAARAEVPVVGVPEGWTSPNYAHRTVTVGLEDPEGSQGLIRAGVREAAERNSGLRVLHAVDIPDVYRESLLSASELQEWIRRDTGAIHAAIDAVAKEAGVQVEVEVHRSAPADLLIEATRTSELIVLGRHDALIPVGSHLGSVARAVIRDSACPVMLVAANGDLNERKGSEDPR